MILDFVRLELAAAVEQATAWITPAMTFAGVVVTAAVTLIGTLIVQRANRRYQEAQARNHDAQAIRTEAETLALVEKAEDDDRDRDLGRMQRTLDFAFGALDRLAGQVEKYEKQIADERTERERQLDEHAALSRHRHKQLQEQADERHARIMEEVDALRNEISDSRRRILAHTPWDLRASALLRARLDPDFPDPPEL